MSGTAGSEPESNSEPLPEPESASESIPEIEPTPHAESEIGRRCKAKLPCSIHKQMSDKQNVLIEKLTKRDKQFSVL
jgi:hypothetical protein